MRAGRTQWGGWGRGASGSSARIYVVKSASLTGLVASPKTRRGGHGWAARSAFRFVHDVNAGAPAWRAEDALARPMGAVAIRLPERMSSQLALVVPQVCPRLFVHEGARQALERKLAVALTRLR